MISKFSVVLVGLVFVLTSVHSSSSAQIILNGSMTGPVSDNLAPPDWFQWQKTADTVDETGPFNNTGVNWTLSPNGGTFVRAGGSTFVESEAIGQNVSGFTIGNSYTVSFFQTNLGFEHPTSGAWIGEDGYWDLVINGATMDSSSVLSRQSLATDPIVWSADSMTFIAPTNSVEIALVSRSVHPAGLAAYMGIDGVRLNSVPEPGAGVFMGIFLVIGLAKIRRRR